MADHVISGFHRGEVSPLFYGQLENKDYMLASREVSNFLIMQSGSLIKRPGTRKSGACRYDDRDVRLEPITVNDIGYLVEIGDNYMRFHQGGSVIESSPGVPFELATAFPYTVIHDLTILKYAEEFHIAHKDTVITVLRKGAGATDWTLGVPDYYPHKTVDDETPPVPADANGDAPTTPVTAVRLNGSDEFAYGAFMFYRTDKGQKFFLKTASGKVGWFTINKVVLDRLEGKEVTDPDDTAKTVVVEVSVPDNYAEGTYTAITGTALMTDDVITEWAVHFTDPRAWQPNTIASVDSRFVLAGVGHGMRIIGSVSIGGYEFRKGFDHNDCYDFTLKEVYGRRINWITGDSAIMIGTDGGIYAPAGNEPISPAGAFSLLRQTSYQASAKHPELAGNFVLFIQQPGTAIRELSYDFDTQKYHSNSLSFSAEHMFRSGVKEIAHQQSPYEIMWAVNNDGELCSMAIFRDGDKQIYGGWTRQKFDGFVFDVSVTKETDGSDQVYIAIRRNTGDGYRTYIERLEFYRLDQWEKAWYVDNGFEWLASSKGMDTLADDGTFTPTAGSTFVDGEVVYFAVNPSGCSGLAGNLYRVTEAAGVYHIVQYEDSTAVSGIGNSTAAFTVLEAKNEITLDSTVPDGTVLSVFVDSGSYGNVTVAAGKVTLSSHYRTIRAGWGYTARLHTMMLPVAINMQKRVYKAGVYFFESTAATIKPNGGEETVMIMDNDIVLDTATDLWTGVKTVNLSPMRDKYAEVVIESSQPTACNILAVSLEIGG